MSVSVLILTHNEEANLPACLESVKWSDDIVVFDSFSTDRTVEIARAFGARVVQRAFDNERDHRAASLQLPFKHAWVYNPDADEVTPPALREEIRQTVADPARTEAAYRVRFQTIFRGKWIKHSSLYPTWVVRLFRPEAVSFERSINLRYVVRGGEGRLQNHFEHHTFRKGLDAWFDKHNRYSSAEARESLRSLAAPSWKWTDFFRRAPVPRRRALKELSFRLPGRPFLRFLYMYVVRGGFLDGRAGFDYCLLLAIYEAMIVLKMNELREGQRKRPPRGHVLLVVLAGWLVLVLAAFFFAKDLLRVASPPQHADVLVVLGGESVGRAKKALELFQEGAAPAVIASGDGDAPTIARFLERGGVPAAAIQTEVRSRNTKENAAFTVPMLRAMGARRVIIVTSWFHSRRALNTFCACAPDIEFLSAPSPLDQPWQAEATHVSQEYLKTAWYLVRYGISPWRPAAS